MFDKIRSYFRHKAWKKLIAHYKKCHTYEIHCSEHLFGWPFYDTGDEYKGFDPIHALKRDISHNSRWENVAPQCRTVYNFRYTTENWARYKIVDLDTGIIYFVAV